MKTVRSWFLAPKLVNPPWRFKWRMFWSWRGLCRASKQLNLLFGGCLMEFPEIHRPGFYPSWTCTLCQNKLLSRVSFSRRNEPLQCDVAFMRLHRREHFCCRPSFFSVKGQRKSLLSSTLANITLRLWFTIAPGGGREVWYKYRCSHLNVKSFAQVDFSFIIIFLLFSTTEPTDIDQIFLHQERESAVSSRGKVNAALFNLSFIGSLRVLLVGEGLHQISRRIVKREVIKTSFSEVGATLLLKGYRRLLG